MITPSTIGPHRELVDGRYRLAARLGRGATAEVWRATDERLQRDVALKLFRPDVTDRHRERVELGLMVRLSHPGLVSVYDAGEYSDDDGRRRTYLVLEFVTGGTLRERLALDPLPAARAADIGASVARALEHVHAHGVVHRDVKPANILLPGRVDASTAAAKLADFGVARMLDTAHLTEPGTTVGTANYISPEQLRGRIAGPPSDVYSLGLVMYEMRTGQMAYPGSSRLAGAHLDRAPFVPAWCGSDWSSLFTAMTDSDPARRPGAREVATWLTGLRREAEPVNVASAPIAVGL